MIDPVFLIDAKLLKIACPETGLGELALWVEPIKASCRRWGIDTVREVASFLANAAHECRGFTKLSENLNYSADRMAELWPKRYAANPKALKDYKPNALAYRLQRDPVAFANNCYANRMGNGPPESGDGYRHRGFGPFMITGKANQRRFGEAVGLKLADVPDYLRSRDGGALSAGWFWHDNDMDRYAATPGVEDDRQHINGGQIGVSDVRARFNDIIDELIERGA